MRFGAVFDPQLAIYIILALIPNLLIILWAMARLSRDVRLLKQENAMLTQDINLLDQSISTLSSELQGIRSLEGRKTGQPASGRGEGSK
jgi:hypothetical protein